MFFMALFIINIFCIFCIFFLDDGEIRDVAVLSAASATRSIVVRGIEGDTCFPGMRFLQMGDSDELMFA